MLVSLLKGEQDLFRSPDVKHSMELYVLTMKNEQGSRIFYCYEYRVERREMHKHCNRMCQREIHSLT